MKNYKLKMNSLVDYIIIKQGNVYMAEYNLFVEKMLFSLYFITIYCIMNNCRVLKFIDKEENMQKIS